MQIVLTGSAPVARCQLSTRSWDALVLAARAVGWGTDTIRPLEFRDSWEAKRESWEYPTYVCEQQSLYVLIHSLTGSDLASFHRAVVLACDLGYTVVAQKLEKSVLGSPSPSTHPGRAKTRVCKSEGRLG